VSWTFLLLIIIGMDLVASATLERQLHWPSANFSLDLENCKLFSNSERSVFKCENSIGYFPTRELLSRQQSAEFSNLLGYSAKMAIALSDNLIIIQN